MEDSRIIDLYWERNQRAITLTQQKYGAYCGKIADNILHDRRDCEECLNDTWLRAWNSMPSERPDILSAFLAAITRNISLDRYRKGHAKKRGSGELPLIYDELSECIGRDDTDNHTDMLALTGSIRLFLKEQDPESRVIFLRRYWYMDSIKEIAQRMGIGESKVKSSLFRTRNRFRKHLIKDGFEI